MGSDEQSFLPIAEIAACASRHLTLTIPAMNMSLNNIAVWWWAR